MTETPQQTKPFFHLGKPDIEYSTDFDFFLKNQIWTVQKNSGYHSVMFYSSLESKYFDRIKKITSNGSGVISNEEILEKCREIHNKLMAGEYGNPTFVD